MEIISSLNKLFRLNFSSDKLESKYQKEYDEEHLWQNILAAKLSIVLYAIYAPATYLLIQNEALLLFYVFSFSISMPIVLIFISKSDFFKKYQRLFLYIVAVAAGSGAMLFYTFTHNDRAMFQVDTVIPIIAIFTMYGIGFSLALLIVGTIFSLFILLAFFVSMGSIDMVMALYTMTFAGFISAVSAYMIEKSKRKLFLSKVESEEFRSIIDKSKDYIAIYDMKTFKYLYANQATLDLNALTLEEIKKKTLVDIYTSIKEKELEKILQYILDNESYSDIVKLHTLSGDVVYVHAIAQFGVYDFKQAVIVVSSEVTELKKEEIRIREMAQFDALTKLYNRYKLDEYARQHIQYFKRYQQNVSLIICDIDHFKNVNDTYGHLLGDAILIRIAQIIKETIRESDIAARWGGEEFAILLANTSLNDALSVAKKIHENVVLEEHKNVGKVYISCGVAQLFEDESYESWFKRTDEALYTAKENGRNQIIISKP